MKTLHSVKPEKERYSWLKKIPEWAIQFEDLNRQFIDLNRTTSSLYNSLYEYNRFYNGPTAQTFGTTNTTYHVDFPASGVYVDGQYIGEAINGTINIPADGEYHHVVLNDNPVHYWRLDTNGTV